MLWAQRNRLQCLSTNTPIKRSTYVWFRCFSSGTDQFAFTVSFHIIFPAITIGLASYLVVLEGLWLKKRSAVYTDLYHFWSKVFAVNFGMGVVSGLVMAYQCGTNWSGFLNSQVASRAPYLLMKY